jgi:general secretion pathway protein G
MKLSDGRKQGVIALGTIRFRHAEKSGQRRCKSTEAGFTLIELLVVMVILVLLASLVAPRIIGYLGSSRTKAAIVEIQNLSASLELFKLDTGRYPEEREGLAVLVENPEHTKNWNGPYLKKVPNDPWGYPYHYRYPGQRGDFDIFSLGADNRAGGDGENQDVTSWQ